MRFSSARPSAYSATRLSSLGFRAQRLGFGGRFFVSRVGLEVTCRYVGHVDVSSGPPVFDDV